MAMIQKVLIQWTLDVVHRKKQLVKSTNTVKILNIGTCMEQSDQDLHCLPFFLHLLEALLHRKIKLFYTVAGLGVPIFRVFTVLRNIQEMALISSKQTARS